MKRRTLVAASAAILLVAAAGAAYAQDTRTVETELGSVEVPLNPQRVVGMYSTDNDYALVLGLPLVAAGTARGGVDQGFTPFQLELGLDPATPAINVFPDTNWEQVAAAKPDLIIGWPGRADDGYALQSAIAPSLRFDSLSPDWKAILRFLADATGTSEKAEPFIEAYDARLAAVQKQIKPGLVLAEIATAPPGTFQVDEAQWLPFFYKDLGFSQGTIVPDTTEGRTQYSIEQLSLLEEADIILLWREAGPNGGFIEGEYDFLKAAPGWSELPAVKAGRVYDEPSYFGYASPLTALELLEFAEANLVDPK